MKFRRFHWNILIRVILIFASLFFASLAVLKQWYWLEVLMVPVIIYQFFDFYRLNRKAQSEVEQFVESVHYRDFSRHFEVKKAPAELQPFRTGFNQINSTFKVISKEKETQYLHLKSILEIVETGILSYEMESGEIMWMNESLKNLLHIPYLKTIQSLEKRNEDLFAEIIKLPIGESRVTSFANSDGNFKMLLSATSFISDGKNFKLIAFQNINEALDESESQAWQKLLSVMTHEIMNSVAPISSLAETLKERIKDQASSPESFGDIEMGINTILKRSEGLLKFTETYRSLSKITKANVAKVLLIELIGHVQQLMQPTLEKKGINLEMILRDPFLTIEADSGLIEQVLINLLLNGIDAVKEKSEPKIIISAESSLNGKVVVKVADNGSGIKEELLDKIFIPFFSTKKAGNGIGLSLCKQVMMLHKGNINVQSTVGEGTLFTLQF